MNRDIGHSENFIEIDLSGGDVELPASCRGIYTGSGGNLVVQGWDDNQDTTFTGLSASMGLPVGVRFIRTAGTTCTGLVALL